MSKEIRRVSHPGIYLKDAIEELGMSQSEFAYRTGLSIKNVSTIITGDSRITFEAAIKLANFFNTSVEGWINLQTKYDLFIANENKEKELEDEWKIAVQFKDTFIGEKVSPDFNKKNKEEVILDLRRMLKVGNLSALRQPDIYAFCKTSIKKDLNEKNVVMRNAWISVAEEVARKKTCSSFNKGVIL